MSTLKINQRFQELHRQQTDDERAQLEADILAEGRVRDPIVVMQGDVILDGHNRYEVATKHKLKFTVAVKQFDDDLAAEKWILRNQLARRNLSPHDYKITLGRLYNDEKKDHTDNLKQGDKTPKGQNDISGKTRGKRQETAEKVAAETGSSPSTVKRAGKRAEAYDKLPKSIKTLIDEKPSRASDKAVVKMSELESGTWSQLARQVRTGQKATFDEALGLKAAKKAGTSDSEPDWKVARSKAVKTAEALLRALDDLYDAKPNELHASLMARTKSTIADLRKWK